MTVTLQTAVTELVEADGVLYAYRRFGEPADVPLVLLAHFRGNLDSWDPAPTDALAASREIVLVDAPGVGARPARRSIRSPGQPRRSSRSSTRWGCARSIC